MIPSGNPFAFPGMPGAAPSFDPGAANPVMQSLDMMRQVWGNLGSMASAAPGGNVPGLDELDKRITDLRAIENWLNLNLTMLRGSIQGLEVQRATISTLRNFAQNVSSAYQSHSPSGPSDADAADLPPPSPLEIVLGLRKAPGAAADASPFGFSATAAPPAAPAAAPSAAPTGWPHMPAHMPAGAAPPMPPSAPPFTPPPMPQAAQDPSPQAGGQQTPPADAPAEGSASAAPDSPQANAWWAMLQDQFNKITAAASQAVPAVTSLPPMQMPHIDLGKAAVAAARTVFEPSRAPDAPARKAAPPAERSAPPARKTSAARKRPASTSPAKKASSTAAGKTAAKRAPAASKAPARKAPARGARGKA